jgi:hypothetical protein
LLVVAVVFCATAQVRPSSRMEAKNNKCRMGKPPD